MPPAGFEPAIPASERPQTRVLDRAVTGTDAVWYNITVIKTRMIRRKLVANTGEIIEIFSFCAVREYSDWTTCRRHGKM
jgi:hypothetical protein